MKPFFGLKAALRGWAMSSALIGCLVGALLSGEWSDKYGRKKMLIIASFSFVWSASMGQGRLTVLPGLLFIVSSVGFKRIAGSVSLR